MHGQPCQFSVWGPVWAHLMGFILVTAMVFTLAVMQRWVHADVEVHETLPACSPL